MRFRKKPVEIEAVRWDGTPESATRVIDWVLSQGGTANYICDNGVADGECDLNPELHHLVIWTLEGAMKASHGDWIIRGVQGEFYPCKPDIFEQTYEVVDAS